MGNELILVIDDDPATRRIIQKILASKGFQVETAASDVEGLAVLNRTRPALVILDLHLPQLHATHIIERIQADPIPPMLVVISSDYEGHGWARRAGAVSFLRKPITFANLLGAVRCLRRAHQSQPTPALPAL